MKRTHQLLAIVAASALSALALAQSQQPGSEEAEAVADEWSGGRYVDLRHATPITGNAAAGEAKSQLCAACHGPDGISIAPTFPNIGGQRADFLYWQLVEFKRNPDSPMSPLVADLSDEDMRDLSVYYAGLAPTPQPAESAPEDVVPDDATLLQRGEQLYLSGDPSKGIPACQGCHGPDARGPANALYTDRSGHTPYATWPALRGQQAMYLQTRLAEYRDGKMDDSTTDFVMTGIGQRLDDDSIQALSAWLSSLPPAE